MFLLAYWHTIIFFFVTFLVIDDISDGDDNAKLNVIDFSNKFLQMRNEGIDYLSKPYITHLDLLFLKDFVANSSIYLKKLKNHPSYNNQKHLQKKYQII